MYWMRTPLSWSALAYLLPYMAGLCTRHARCAKQAWSLGAPPPTQSLPDHSPPGKHGKHEGGVCTCSTGADWTSLARVWALHLIHSGQGHVGCPRRFIIRWVQPRQCRKALSTIQPHPGRNSTLQLLLGPCEKKKRGGEFPRSYPSM